MTQSINQSSLTNNIEHNLEDLKEKELMDEVEEKDPEPPVIVLEKTPPEVQFWGKNPNALFKSEHILEFFPTNEMSFNEQLNSLTRTILVLTLVLFLFTKKTRVLVISVVCILCIYFMHYANNKTLEEEGFDQGNDLEKLYDRKGPLVEIQVDSDSTFQKPEPDNPLSNVLVSDYDYNVNKKPAPPAYTKQTNEEILNEAKKTVQLLNPRQPNIDKKLFRDVYDNLEFEQSMRQFYSTANTTIPNDQASFAEFCYGDMISAKEGNMFALTRDNPRFNLY